MNKLFIAISLTALLLLTGCAEVAQTPDYIENGEEEAATDETTEAATDEMTEDTQATETESNTEDQVDSSVDTEAAAETQYTMAAVATHNSKESCWSVIDGKVYDLTSWISKHPGGAGNILKICGIDGTSAFSGQHGGNAHANAELADYFLAELQ